MNWTHVEGQWRRLRGQVKSNWARLSDADIVSDFPMPRAKVAQ